MKIREDLFVKYPTGLLRDLRILTLIQEFPYMGDSLYMRLNAFMMESENCEIPFDGIKALSLILVSSEDDISKVVARCIQLGLYVKNDDGTAFFSEALKKQRLEIEIKSQKYRENGRKGGKAKATKQQVSDDLAIAKQSVSDSLANKKNKKNQNQTENQTENQTQMEEDASTSATTAAEKPPDYSPELCALSDEIAAKFGYRSGRRFDRQVVELINNLRPGDGFQRIPEALKKLDSAKAIIEGKIKFSIGSFLDYYKFLKLFSGDYDDLYTR